jgi:hypothetical protein
MGNIYCGILKIMTCCVIINIPSVLPLIQDIPVPAFVRRDRLKSGIRSQHFESINYLFLNREENMTKLIAIFRVIMMLKTKNQTIWLHCM